MKHNKTGVLVVNLGTPDHYTVPYVRKYLREFLMDARVIDIPHFKRWLLVNLIIAPFRAPKSAKVYQQLWTDKGSPLLFYGEEIGKKLQLALGENFIVQLGMRYQNPSIKAALGRLKKNNISSLIILPMFPQYASATTGSIHQEVMEQIKEWENIPELHFVKSYCNDEGFIKAFAERSREKLENKEFDLMLFSYHGLPERQVLKASENGICKLDDCCAKYGQQNQFCYRAQCYETTRLLAKELEIPEDKYQVVFQSRLGKSPWIQPYADEVIRSLPSKGIKKVAVMMPSFVADCLETIVEVGSEFKEIFEDAGGEEWIFIESLNDSESWIQTIEKLIRKNLH